jgi:hypothetical protein
MLIPAHKDRMDDLSILPYFAEIVMPLFLLNKLQITFQVQSIFFVRAKPRNKNQHTFTTLPPVDSACDAKGWMLNWREEVEGSTSSPRARWIPEEGGTMAKATINRRSKVGRPGNLKPVSKRVTTGGTGGKSATGFSESRSIEELAAEQGVKPTKLEDILGKGADLWESDQEFERFVEGIYARRREDRELAKP